MDTGPDPTLDDLIGFFSAGRLPEALSACQGYLSANPDDPVAHNIMGMSLLSLGQTDGALAAIRRAVAIKPDYAQGHNNLGNALKSAGDPAGAESAYRAALDLMPDLLPALANLGIVLRELGRRDEAAATLTRAVALEPNDAAIWSNLAAVDYERQRYEDAAKAARRAVALAPDLAAAQTNLGNAAARLGRQNEALAAFGAALATASGNPHILYDLGKAQSLLGLMAPSAETYRKVLAIDPGHAHAASNLLMTLHYIDGLSADAVAGEHRAIAGALYPDGGGRPVPAAYAGPIRIGFVSPDLKDHSVARFLEPLLGALDRAKIHVTCFSHVETPDRVTARLKGLSNGWVDLCGLDTRQAVAAVREADIDLLIDLAGHSARNRLDLFAARAAPVQATWLGYPNTTGLTQIDYRITDAAADPEGDADTLNSEKLIRLSKGFLCYSGAETVPVAPLPSRDGGPVTFGSFNNIQKLSNGTVVLWSKVLAACDGSTLLLKSRNLADPVLRQRIIDRFGAHGIDGARIRFADYTATQADHLALYGQIDIALDPVLYNGTTTTCEALWMGVPVVTLAGDRHAARVGVSLLSAAGMPDLIAEDEARFVEIAGTLADPAGRTDLAARRASLRDRLKVSSLCDAQDFARRMEAAFEAMVQPR
ncbi:MAG: tetratricopeptide repeat protein [Alphaproteobacteria bacterium]